MIPHGGDVPLWSRPSPPDKVPNSNLVRSNFIEECAEQTRLREAYQSALLAWTKAGGTDPSKIHLESVKAAKTELDEAATELVLHRQLHGC